MSFWQSGDLDVFLADAPNRLTLGTVTVNCWARTTDNNLPGDPRYEQGDPLGHTIEVLVKTSALTGQKLDAVVTLDGESYQIRESRQISDGAFTHLLLA